MIGAAPSAAAANHDAADTRSRLQEEEELGRERRGRAERGAWSRRKDHDDGDGLLQSDGGEGARQVQKHAHFCCVRRLWPIDSAATRALVHVKEPIAPLSRASSIHLISSSTKRSFTHEQHFGVHVPCHTVRTRTILALLVPLFFLTFNRRRLNSVNKM